MEIAVQKFVKAKIKSAMTKDVITVSPELSLKSLEEMFNQYRFNMFPVVENKQLIGIVSEYDFLKAFVTFGSDLRNPKPYEKITEKKTVRDIYSPPVTLRQWHPLTYALEMMAQSMYKSFPVINDKDKLVGVIARKDLIRMLKAK